MSLMEYNGVVMQNVTDSSHDSVAYDPIKTRLWDRKHKR